MNFRNIKSVEQLYETGIIQRPNIVEKQLDKDELELKNSPKNNPDHFEVIYADKIKKYTNIFKHIIVFTNNRDPKENKTLKNIYDAIDNLKKDKCPVIPEIHVFVAAKMEADEREEEIVISDGKESFTIKEESNLDTLIFSRLSVQGEDQCEHIVELLQDRGFLVLNPVKYSTLACDKYETAVLFEKGNIPQPNFTLMTKDILYNEERYNDAMRSVYPNWSEKDSDKNGDLTFVVKILDGHGGTGVAMIDGKKILAWLQLIFAVDPERRLIIQKKEDADGGDIRVHVLTLRDKQIIIAAMKRIKLNNDFRSNVSLGASAEPVKLTSEQEQIALKVARLSRLPWCAVDIMPLVKGSNKELGDNVVLEINSSPGTAGITDVIGENFINILLNELDDPSQFLLQDKVAGYVEAVKINFGDGLEKDLLAKLDTGNSSKASHIEVGKFVDDGKYVTFQMDGKKFKFKKIGESASVTGTQIHNRPIISIPGLTLGLRKLLNIPISVVESRDRKSTNCLLNRETLSLLGYVVHPNKTHILTQEMEKVKIL